MIDRELFAAVDACRPGDLPDESVAAKAALADSQVVELRKRIEAADRRIGSALHDVEMPAGLAERVLSRLASAEAPPATARGMSVLSVGASALGGRESFSPGRFSAGEDDNAKKTPDPTHTPAPAAVPRRVNRRLFVVAGLAATAAAVLIAVQMLEKPQKPWTVAEVLGAAIERYISEDAQATGRPMAEAPQDYPYSRDLREVRELAEARWRPLGDPLAEADGVAYDLSLHDGSRARLFVLAPKAEVVGLPDIAPHIPATPTTQGVCAAAWQDGGRVYVLVVAGGAAEYRKFVKRAAGPLVLARSASEAWRVASGSSLALRISMPPS